MNELQHHSDCDSLLARQVIAASLASGLADPRTNLAQRCDGGLAEIIRGAWDVLRDHWGQEKGRELGVGERKPGDVSVEPLIEWISRTPGEREETFVAVFGLVMTKLCPAYETEYCEWKDATHRAQIMADINGFYHAFSLKPGRETPERPDHVAVELEFMAFLLEKERTAAEGKSADECRDICRNAGSAFLDEHAAWWMPTFGRLLECRLDDLRKRNPDGHHFHDQLIGVARVLCAWIASERTFAGVGPSRRLISPSIAPQEVDDGCGKCSGCAVESS